MYRYPVGSATFDYLCSDRISVGSDAKQRFKFVAAAKDGYNLFFLDAKRFEKKRIEKKNDVKIDFFFFFAAEDEVLRTYAISQIYVTTHKDITRIYANENKNRYNMISIKLFNVVFITK